MSDHTLSPLLVSSSSAMSFLVVESGSLAGQRFPLPEPPGALLLGRERLCNVRFDPERDRVVGRTHARLEARPDGTYLVDLNSANGTFRADGTPVRGAVRLSPGDRFQLGGEGGPLLSLIGPAAPVALHVVPPVADAPTIFMRRVEPLGALPRAPVAIPKESAASGSISLAAVAPAEGRLRLRPAEVSSPPSRLIRERSPEPSPTAAEALTRQQQKQYQRQVALIALLLVLACSIGLALGVRDIPGEGDAETTRAE